MDKITSMRIRRSTLDKLKEVGHMGESYEEVIERLVKSAKIKKNK